MKKGILSNKKQLFKVLPICAVAFVLVLVVCGKVVLTSLTSSVYGIGDLNDNLDSIKTGDIITGTTKIKSEKEKFSALLYLTAIHGMKPS